MPKQRSKRDSTKGIKGAAAKNKNKVKVEKKEVYGFVFRQYIVFIDMKCLFFIFHCRK